MNKKEPIEGLFYPDAIFFDWDGTLVDSIAFLTKAHNAVLTDLGRAPMEKEQFEKYFGVPRETLFLEIYGEDAQAGKTGFEAYYHQNHLSEMVVMDGAQTMLDTLYGLNIPMGVVSNKKHDFLQAEVEYLGWKKYFGSAIVGAGVAKADKPDPAPLILGISLYDNIQGERVWYIGDTEVDVACAQSAGCSCILVSPLEIETGNGVWKKNYKEICGFLLQWS